ncbi:hypothetical protein [Roseateles sp.]|uniref:hypothetical protein n=1 Tax=Roseateles sp. TaxID=1971397 RepID=UPI00393F08BC
MSRPFVLLVLTAGLLAACGGGGGGGGSSSSNGGSGDTPAVLAGVAATGAPLVSAKVTVLDGKGASIGTGTTHGSDGSYRITLPTSAPTGPLFVQVAGLDAAGSPQLMFSAVPTVTANMVAHLTPLTTATVALALGTEPGPVFAQAATDSSALPKLASNAAAAQEFLKSLLKTQFSDLKITDPKTLDLLADASFAANKGAHDLLIESVRVDLARSSRNVPLLQLANKFIGGLTPEVVVDLSTAQTELAKTGGTPANAILSTLKATTSATSVLGNLGVLDDLTAALNQLIATGPDAGALTAHPQLSAYDKHNGALVGDMVTRLYDMSRANRQFGRMQTLGCADDAPSAGACSRVLVAAPVIDASGTVIDHVLDAVTYSKTSITANKWNLIGNGKKLAVTVSPLAYIGFEADGTLSSSLVPNPGIGLLADIQAQKPDPSIPTNPPVKLMDTATLQMPGGFSIAFGYCNRPSMCISSTPGTTSLIPTGGIGDVAIQRAAVGWVGSADTVRGAFFRASYTTGGAAEVRPVYLRSDVLSDPARARFPTLDGGLSSTKPLKAGDLQSGTLAIAWQSWATANPDMRLIEIRRVYAPSTGSPTVANTTVPLPPAVKATLTGAFTPVAAVRTELWLGAVDGQGRRYYTRYLAAP